MWKDVVKSADKATAMDFIHYLCDKYDIKSEGLSWEYFRQYKQLYNIVNGCHMDTSDSKEIRKARLCNLSPD